MTGEAVEVTHMGRMGSIVWPVGGVPHTCQRSLPGCQSPEASMASLWVRELQRAAATWGLYSFKFILSVASRGGTLFLAVLKAGRL